MHFSLIHGLELAGCVVAVLLGIILGTAWMSLLKVLHERKMWVTSCSVVFVTFVLLAFLIGAFV